MSRDDALAKLFEELSKDKNNAISTFRASDIRLASHVPYGILTGIPQLDLALGRSGLPVGRVIELYGLPMSGKTTSALMILAQAQKMGGSGLFIDTEYAFDSDRAEELGVDIENLQVAEASTIEEVFRIINTVLEGLGEYTKPFVIITDSVGGAATRWETEKDPNAESDRPGVQAKAIKRGVRLVTSKVAKKTVLLLMINHSMETLAPYGPRTKSTGGHALKFASSARINFTHLSKITKDNPKDKKYKERLGQNIKIELEKVKGSHLKFPCMDVELLNDGGFNSKLSLLKAMVNIGEIATPNTRTYVWNDKTFGKSDWDNVIYENGGFDQVYKQFIVQACTKEFMKPWSQKDLKG